MLTNMNTFPCRRRVDVFRHRSDLSTAFDECISCCYRGMNNDLEMDEYDALE